MKQYDTKEEALLRWQLKRCCASLINIQKSAAFFDLRSLLWCFDGEIEFLENVQIQSLAMVHILASVN